MSQDSEAQTITDPATLTTDLLRKQVLLLWRCWLNGGVTFLCKCSRRTCVYLSEHYTCVRVCLCLYVPFLIWDGDLKTLVWKDRQSVLNDLTFKNLSVGLSIQITCNPFYFFYYFLLSTEMYWLTRIYISFELQFFRFSWRAHGPCWWRRTRRSSSSRTGYPSTQKTGPSIFIHVEIIRTKVEN